MNSGNNQQTVGDINNSTVKNVNIKDSNCNDKNRKLKNKNMFLSIVAIGVSIIAFFIALSSVDVLSANAYVIIIGLISLVIPLLIGWNIYTALDLKNEINEIRRKNQDMSKIFDEKINTLVDVSQNIDERSGKRVLTALAKIEEEFFLFHINSGRTTESYIINHIFEAVLCYAQVNNYNKANETTEMFLKVLKDMNINLSNIKVTDDKREKLYDLLKTIQNPNKIDKIQDLYNLVSKLDKQDEMHSLEHSTQARISISQHYKNNVQMYEDAIKAIRKNIQELKEIVGQQKNIEDEIVKRIADLTNILINSSFVNDLDKPQLKLLLSAIKNNDDKNEVDLYVRNIIDTLCIIKFK